MNRNEYLKNLEIKNRRLLLKIYQREINKLKIKIYEATEKGNDTVYLQKLHDEVEQEIKVFKQALKGYSVKSATDSYKGGAKLALLGAAELSNKFEFGKVNRDAIRVLAQTTYKPLSKMAQHIGRATLEYMKRENFQNTQTVLKALNKTFGRKLADSEFLRKTGIEGVADVVVGSSSWQKAAREIRDKIISDADYNVPYYKKNGDLQRWVQAKDYAKMVSRTTTANIAREGAKDSILDTFDGEFDLVEILGHSKFPNSPCIPYQGNILSIEGIVKGYTTVAEAEANGLFHPNCIHSYGVTDAVMEIYRKDEYEVNESKEEKPEEEIKGEIQQEKPKEEFNSDNARKILDDSIDNNKDINNLMENAIKEHEQIIKEYEEFNQNYYASNRKGDFEQGQYWYKKAQEKYIKKGKYQNEIGEQIINKLNKTSNNIQIKAVRGLEDIALETQTNLNKLINKDIISNETIPMMRTFDDRSSFVPVRNLIQIDDTALNRKDIGTTLHETMHWLEHNNKNILNKSVAFLEYRTEGETAKKLSELTGLNYKETEIAKKDRFFSPYVGKIYKKNNEYWGTEILSMGVEELYNHPIDFYKKDKEYFNFIVAVLRNQL